MTVTISWLTIIVVAEAATFGTSLPVGNLSIKESTVSDDAYPRILLYDSETTEVEWGICAGHSLLSTKINEFEPYDCFKDMTGIFEIHQQTNIQTNRTNVTLTIRCSPRSLLQKRLGQESFKDFYIQVIHSSNQIVLGRWRFVPGIDPAMSETPNIPTSPSLIPAITSGTRPSPVVTTTKDAQESNVSFTALVPLTVVGGIIMIILIVIIIVWKRDVLKKICCAFAYDNNSSPKADSEMDSVKQLVDLEKPSKIWQEKKRHRTKANRRSRSRPSGVYGESSGSGKSESSA